MQTIIFNYLFHPKSINLTSDAINCFFTHCVQNLVEDLRKWLDYLFCYISRNFLIIRLCYSACDACKRVAVFSEVSKNQPTALTRIAAPFPKETAPCGLLEPFPFLAVRSLARFTSN